MRCAWRQTQSRDAVPATASDTAAHGNETAIDTAITAPDTSRLRNMKTFIGDKEVFLSTVLLVPDHVQSRIEVNVQGWLFKLAIVFRPDAEGAANYVFAPDGQGGLKMTFNGWKDSLGTAMLEPVKIGTAPDGRAIGFQIFHMRAGTMNRADIQILFGGVYGGK